MNSRKKTDVFKAAGCVSILGLFLFYFFRCPIYWIIGLPCPGCNFRSAFFALARGDLKGSLIYHAMLIPTVVMIVLASFLNWKQRKKLLVFWVLCMLAYYFLRMIFYAGSFPMQPNDQALLPILLKKAGLMTL